MISLTILIPAAVLIYALIGGVYWATLVGFYKAEAGWSDPNEPWGQSEWGFFAIFWPVTLPIMLVFAVPYYLARKIGRSLMEAKAGYASDPRPPILCEECGEKLKTGIFR